MSLVNRWLNRMNAGPPDPQIVANQVLEREQEQRLFQSSVFPSNSQGDGSAMNMSDLYGHMRDEQALRMIAVYACCRLLSDSVASLPFNAYRMEGEGKTAARVKIEPQPTLVAAPGGPDEDDPTNFEFFFQVMSSLVLNGNAYLVITRRDYRDNPLELYAVHPDDVSISRNTRDGKADYRIGNELVPRYDVVHIKRFVLAGKLTGLSPIGLAAQGISLGMAAERYGARYFYDAANPSSVLETEANLGPEASANVMRNWMATHGGHRYPAILSGGLKYKPIALNPNEAQFLETRKFQRTDIAMLFGIPPHMISDTEKSTSYGTGIEQQGIGFVVYTLRPWVTCIEHAFNKITPRGTFTKFNVDGLLRGDVKSRWDAYIAGRNAGALSVNDIRRLEDMPPVPGGDVYLQPMNYVPLGTKPEDYPTGDNHDPSAKAPADGSPGTDPSNKNGHELSRSERILQKLSDGNGNEVLDLGSIATPEFEPADK